MEFVSASMSCPSPPLRVGLDLTALLPASTGVDRYLLRLAEALGRAGDGCRLTAFVNWEDRDRVTRLVPPAVRVRSWSLRPRAVRLAFQQAALPAASLGLDVVHSPSFIMPLARGAARHVLTVYDMTFFSRPQDHEPLRRSRPYLWAVRTSLRRADLVTVPSEATRRAVLRWAPEVDPERLRLVPAGVDPRFVPVDGAIAAAALDRLGVRPPYLLYLGTLEPRKNLVRLVEAFARLVSEGAFDGRLVLAGRPGWGLGPLDAAVAASGCDERVVRTGYVADDDLPALLSGAAAMVYPSLEEGFGFPPLEAMACGAPVVASRSSSLEENLDGAAELVDPEDPAALAGAIRRLLEDPGLRRRRVEAGRRRAACFSWDRTAGRTLACYRDAAGLAASSPALQRAGGSGR